MKTHIAGLWLATVVFVTGCASTQQTSVELQNGALQEKGLRIGVVMTAVPKPDTYFPGAGCLLCMATASMVNSSLTNQVRTWQTKDLEALRGDLATKLRDKGLDVVVITQDIDISRLPDRTKEPNFARKDFSALRAAHKIDKLLVVQIDSLGATRNYSAYIATGDARATVNGVGYVVNLSSHALEWYQPFAVSVAASEKWDEPPQYPGLTNAFFQALELTMDQVKQPFAK